MSVIRLRDYQASRKCARFDLGFIDIPTLPWDYYGEVTIEYEKFLLSSEVKRSALFQFAESNALDNRIIVHSTWSDNNLYWDFGNNTSGRVNDDYSPYMGRWAKIKLFSSGNLNTKMEIYVDDSRIQSKAGSSAPTTALNGLQIGRFWDGSVADLWQGWLTNVKIYQASTLILDMPLKEDYNDYSGNGYHGTASTGVSLTIK